jgi:hypothetical protein
MDNPHAVENPQVEHEGSDVPVGAVLRFVFGLVAVVALACAGMVGLFRWLNAVEAEQKESRYPLAARDRQRELPQRLPPERDPGERVPAEPRLEGLDLRLPERSGVPGYTALGVEQRARQREELERPSPSRGVDGKLRIPIVRAMDLVAERLAAPPGREKSGAPRQLPLDSSSGRTNEEVHR